MRHLLLLHHLLLVALPIGTIHAASTQCLYVATKPSSYTGQGYTSLFISYEDCCNYCAKDPDCNVWRAVKDPSGYIFCYSYKGYSGLTTTPVDANTAWGFESSACSINNPTSPAPYSISSVQIRSLRMLNGTVSLNKVATVGQQSISPNLSVQQPGRALAVANSVGTAALVLSNLERIGTLPSVAPTVNVVTGLMSSDFQCPVGVFVGTRNTPFVTEIINAPGANLSVECVAANNLLVNNFDGGCLQVWMPQARTLTCGGNRPIEIFTSPSSMPTLINVTGMSSWGVPAAPSRSPTNTRIYVRLGLMQSDGNALGVNQTAVVGQLPFRVPEGAFFAIVMGCQATKVDCRVVDSAGRNVCRFIDRCLIDASAAKDVLAAVRDEGCTQNLGFN